MITKRAVLLVALLSREVTAWEIASLGSIRARHTHWTRLHMSLSTARDDVADITDNAPLCMVERRMPIMEPAEYERALQQWVRETGSGEIVRWYISNVDEAVGEATAEVVIVRGMQLCAGCCVTKEG